MDALTFLICTEEGESFLNLLDRKGFCVEYLEDENLFKIDNFSGVSFKWFEDSFKLRSFACDFSAHSIVMSPDRLLQFVRCQIFNNKIRTIKPPKKTKSKEE